MTDSDNNLLRQNVQVQGQKVYIQFSSYKHSDGILSRHTVMKQPSMLICPVKNMSDYLQIRGSKQGPLFISTSGEPVQQRTFNAQLKVALEFAGYSAERYKSHSFRIGGASLMAAQGASITQIQQAGRWKTYAFLSYIRINQ